jgi:hypothetical protein
MQGELRRDGTGFRLLPPMQRRAVVPPERISLDEAIIYGGVHASKKV